MKKQDIQALFIDVGGSNTKVYKLVSKEHIELGESKKTPKSAERLAKLISDIAHKYCAMRIVIGLPGPIFGKESEVYMPPLGYSIDLLKLKNDLKSMNTICEIYNDCALMHKLAKDLPKKEIIRVTDTSETQVASICITIGTSFGINGITCSGSSISLEMAHIPWYCLVPEKNKIAKSMDYYAGKVCDVINSKYLLACLQECKNTDDLKEMGQYFCEALLSSAQIAATLLGIKKFELIVVTGIYSQVEKLIREVDIEVIARKNAKNLTKVSICPQRHLDQFSSYD